MSTAEETARSAALEGAERAAAAGHDGVAGPAEAEGSSGPAEAVGASTVTSGAGTAPEAAQDGVRPREEAAGSPEDGDETPDAGGTANVDAAADGDRPADPDPDAAVDGDETPDAADADAPGEKAARRVLSRPRRSFAGWPRRRLAAVAVLLVTVLLSGGLLYAATQLRDPAASGNRALTDTAATDQVAGEVSSALTRIFAYTPDDTQSTAQAARDVLDGTAATQYQALFGQIRQQVASQRLTLTTRVVRAGVVSLTASRARLLVFLDQTAQRAGGTATSAAAQLSVTAEFKGGHWRITRLTAR